MQTSLQKDQKHTKQQKHTYFSEHAQLKNKQDQTQAGLGNVSGGNTKAVKQLRYAKRQSLDYKPLCSIKKTYESITACPCRHKLANSTAASKTLLCSSMNH